MKMRSALLLTLICIAPINLHAAGNDAAGCKDHPLLPRLPGYSIVACGSANASFDMEKATAGAAETIHVEGDSWAVAYSPPATLQPKPDREQILSSFERAVAKYDGTLIGRVNAIPVYRLANAGSEIWVVVIADPTGGGYAYRVIDRADRTETKKEEVAEDNLNCVERYGPPLIPTLAGYDICGCGEAESGSREFKTTKGKKVRVEGRITQMTWCPKRAGQSLSAVQIRGRLENRVKKQGATFIGHSATDARIDVYRVKTGGTESWVEVWAEEDGNYNYVVTRKGN